MHCVVSSVKQADNEKESEEKKREREKNSTANLSMLFQINPDKFVIIFPFPN